MENREQIKQYIKACEHMIKFFTKLIENTPSGYRAISKDDRLKELTELRYEIKKAEWPEAENLTIQHHQKILKTMGELISVPIRNKSILDFGSCHTDLAKIAKNKFEAKTVVVFDCDLCQKYETNLTDPSIVSTDNFRIVEQSAPYDIIVINDVLDHTEKPVYWLKRLNQLLVKNTGRLFVRVHPWTSRNGTHLSEQINKAYLHLIFSDDELATLGVTNKFTRKIIDDVESYKRYFEESSLKMLNHKIYKKSIDLALLQNKVVIERIKNNTNIQDNLFEKLEIEFIDFELKN